MFLKYTVLFISGLALCLIIISAAAQTADEDRQAIRSDQQTLDEAYRQLQQDRLVGNAAGVEIDQDNIATAEQDFRTDMQRAVANDQKAAAADQQALDALDQKLQQDTKQNPAAVAADQNDIGAAQQKLQTDKQQAVADDGLEVTRDQQALDNENWQLQQDMKGPSYAVGGENTVQADEQSVQEATTNLQHAQLKLQLDRDIQSEPR